METTLIQQCAIIKQSSLRPICHEILENEIRPIHYADLAKMVIKKAGYVSGYNEKRIKEDLREKILSAGLDGSGYIGSPYCFGYKKKWIKTSQSIWNFGETPIRISPTISSSTAGACEMIYRFKHMVYKPTNTYISIEDANENIVRFRIEKSIIERNVSDYFKRRWPNLWLPPSNENQYRKPSPDDFRIKVNGSIYDFDVCTPNRNGKIGNVKWKKPAHIHVVAENIDDNIDISGFIPGTLFSKNQWSVNETYPIHQLIFWLNCVDQNIPYKIFKQSGLN